MALVFHDGFETGGAEAWASVTGSPTFIAGAAANGSNYGMRCNATGSAVYANSGKNIYGGSANYYIVDLPDSDTPIMGNTIDGVVLKTTGYIELLAGGTVRDTSDTQLQTGQWYRISWADLSGSAETKIYIDGVEECVYGVREYIVGRFGVIDNVTCDLYVDDVAIDGSIVSGDLGDIRTLAARPVGEGTDQDVATTAANGWANAADSANGNYTEIDDDPPSITSFNNADNNNTDRYSAALDECGSGNLAGIGGTDTIEAVNFFWYYETEGGGTTDYGIRIRCSDDAGSPKTNDNIDDPKDPTWLASYEADTPVGANAWTQAYVNSLEMGMAAITSGSKGIWFYEAYAMVAYKISTVIEALTGQSDVAISTSGGVDRKRGVSAQSDINISSQL